MISAPVDFDRVEVRDVSRHFGRRRALAHVTMDLYAGELTGLFGPNGAGKSTLLSVLSTLMHPTGGAVTYGGRLGRDLGDALRGRIGMLGHDLFLYGDLTARENLEFFGRLYSLDDVPRRARAALAAARLDDRADDRVSSFSRGMRQRLALERAILHGPRLVLLDEPFTGLDDASSAAVTARLNALRAAGAIVVMATHDFDSADRVVSRAWYLRDGRAGFLPDTGGTLRERYRAAIRRAGE
jgi:heme exporter protein A